MKRVTIDNEGPEIVGVDGSKAKVHGIMKTVEAWEQARLCSFGSARFFGL